MIFSKNQIAIVVLIAVVIALGYGFYSAESELIQARKAIAQKTINEKTLAFTRLFIEKVLKAENEVDFETRLNLENSVRDLNDRSISAQWQRFTESETEAEAQIETKNLLDLLIKSIKAN